MRLVSSRQVLLISSTAAAATFAGAPACSAAQSVPRSGPDSVTVTAGGQEAAMPIARLGELARLETHAGARVTGPLRALTPAAVTIEQRPPYIVRVLSPFPLPGPHVTVMRDSIRSTSVLRGPPWRDTALGGGLLVGAALGAFLGARSVHDECEPDTIGCVVPDRSSVAVISGVLGAAVGFALAQIPARKRWVRARLAATDPA